MARPAAAQICIPVSHSEEVVAVPLDQLPDDPDELLDILKAEEAPLQLWLEFAKAYLSQDMVKQFLHILTEGTSEEVVEYFGDRAKYERIQIFCALASYYTAQGAGERDRSKRNVAFNQAQVHLRQAAQIDFDEQLPKLGAGQLALAQGKLDQARRDFQGAVLVKDNGQTNVAPQIALASLAFQQDRIDDALRGYRRALQDNPAAPAEVRLGIAACQYRKGDLGLAAKAYERVLDLDPQNTEALQALAVMKLNSDQLEDKREGLEMLQAAFEVDPTNATVLNLLAHQYLLRGKHSDVERLAKVALDTTEVDKVRARSNLLLARAFHARGDWPLASSYYQQASRLDEGLALPHFGLAQMNLRNEEYKNAISELEAVLQAAPASFDALEVLGHLYCHQPQRVEKAIGSFFESFDKSLFETLTDLDTWEMFGELQAVRNPREALQAYQRGLQLSREAGADGGRTAKILNNTAVIHFRLGDVAAARKAMAEAMAAEGGGAAEGEAEERQRVTMQFNMARLHEAAADFKAARKLYTDIVEERPAYTACYLRLAAISKAEGKRHDAQDWVQKAIDADPRDLNALAMMANLHMERRAWQDVNQCVIEMIKRDKADPCALLIKGNLALNSLPPKGKVKKGTDYEEIKKNHYSKALECYKNALTKDGANAYAANGIGVVLAEQGSMETAKDIFTKVHEAVASNPAWQISLPDAQLNLANIFLACQEYVSAIKLYQNVLTKNYSNKDAGVLLYLARAYYDSENLLEAKRTLLRAIHVAPTDPRLRFNLALVMQQYAVQKLAKSKAQQKQTASERKVSVELAIEELNQALRFFRRLSQLGTATTGIEELKLRKHIEFCSEIVAKAEVLSHSTTKEAEVEEKRLRSQQLALESQKMEAEVARQKARLKEVREKEAREALARQAQERLEQRLEQWKGEQAQQVEAASTAKEPSSSKKRKKDHYDDAIVPDDLDELEERAEAMGGEEEGSDDAREEGHRRLKKRREEGDERPQKMNDLFLDESDDEDGEGERQVGGGDGDDDGNGSGGGEGEGAALEDVGTEAPQPARRGAVLDDEDEDGDGDGYRGEGEEDADAKRRNDDLFGSDNDSD
eukprot:jgi/Tetstr1/456875/TSEL_043547.t1